MSYDDLKYCTSTGVYTLYDLNHNNTNNNNNDFQTTYTINHTHSITNSDTNLNDKIASERKSILLSIFTTFFGGFMAFHTKLALKYFPLNSPNYLILIRGVTMLLYLIAKYYYMNKAIPNITHVKLRMWLFIRGVCYYLNIFFMATALYFIRYSTMMCFFNLTPLFVIILSIFILNEKFRIRYLI